MALNEEFIKVETAYHTPPGGQQVGPVSAGVKVTHEFGGISVTCDLGRSQKQNKDMALGAIEYLLVEAGYTDAVLFKKDEHNSKSS